MQDDEKKKNDLSLKDEAKGLLTKTKEVILEKLKEKFNISAEKGIDFTIALVEVVKEENKNVEADSNKFSELCDNAIATMREAIKDHNLSPEEIERIVNKIEDILKLSDNARKEKLEYSKETRDKTLDTAKKVGIATVITAGATYTIVKGLEMFFNYLKNRTSGK